MFVQTKGIDLILNISSPIGTEDIGTLSLSPPPLSHSFPVSHALKLK